MLWSTIERCIRLAAVRRQRSVRLELAAGLHAVGNNTARSPPGPDIRQQPPICGLQMLVLPWLLLSVVPVCCRAYEGSPVLVWQTLLCCCFHGILHGSPRPLFASFLVYVRASVIRCRGLSVVFNVAILKLAVVWPAAQSSCSPIALHMTLLCPVQALGHASEGDHLKLFKDADADIGSLLAAAPPSGPAAPRTHENTNTGVLGVHPYGLQPWNMGGASPAFPFAQTAALHTAMLPDDARPGSSTLLLPSHIATAPLTTLPLPNVGSFEAPDAAMGIPWTPPAQESSLGMANGDSADAYQDMTTSELLEVYEQQQEELVKLSKELADYTRKNIQLSTQNLEQLQQLQDTNSPIVSNMIMQPPLLSQLATRVRQQAQDPPALLRSDGTTAVAAGSGGAAVGTEDGPRPRSRGSTDEGSREACPEEVRVSRPRGVVTQEQAAAILMQMSQRMADPGASRPS
eukprot:jgi/Ulvmu1/134/UM001_0138.1